MENNTLGSIDGATALKLDESYQLDEQEQNALDRQLKKFDNEDKSNSSETNEQGSLIIFLLVFLLKVRHTLKIII